MTYYDVLNLDAKIDKRRREIIDLIITNLGQTPTPIHRRDIEELAQKYVACIELQGAKTFTIEKEKKNLQDA